MAIDNPQKDMKLSKFTLSYGHGKKFECEIDCEKPVWQHLGPETVSQSESTIQSALDKPLEYPGVERAVVPGDRIAIVVDPETPCWPEIVAALRKRLLSAGIEGDAIRVVLNREINEQDLPANLSPATVGTIISHSEAMKGRSVYLASTAEGQRIYLPEEIGEADFVISVGPFGYDERWGYRGTCSIVYPSFTSKEEQEKFHAGSQQDLTPETSRGARQTIDEVGWLLGLQYTVQVIPSGSGKLGHVISGANDAVYREAINLLDRYWRIQNKKRVETVVISLPTEPGCNLWHAITRTCHAARSLVQAHGRVMLLTDLKELPRELIDPLTMCDDLSDALRLLNSLDSPEAKALHAMVSLAQSSRLYLLSELEPDLLENLYCIPLSSQDEMRKAIQGADSCSLLNGGPFVYVEND